MAAQSFQGFTHFPGCGPGCPPIETKGSDIVPLGEEPKKVERAYVNPPIRRVGESLAEKKEAWSPTYCRLFPSHEPLSLRAPGSDWALLLSFAAGGLLFGTLVVPAEAIVVIDMGNDPPELSGCLAGDLSAVFDVDFHGRPYPLSKAGE
jgi:hypothetical protein